MIFYPRPFQAASADLENMIALVQAAWQPQRRPGANFHIGDMYWSLREPSCEQTLWLWETEQGHLAGYAVWSAAESSLEIQIHPAYTDSDLQRQMLTWAEAQAAVGLETAAASLTTLACEDNISYTNLLSAKGYQRQEKYLNAHLRRLDNRIETPPLPEGYTVRTLQGQEEITARVQGHRAGWQSTRMTEAIYARMMQMPGYRLDLDIVVVAPDDNFAATCNCWLDEENGVGLFEPVSTHPDHRRKGLGRAMMHYGMNRLQALGAGEAWVCSVSHNPASTRLYESCRMEIVRRDFHYSSR